MATVLSITDTEILTLARLNLLTGGDAAQAGADVSSVKSYEQEAQEQRIEPVSLSTAALQPLFRRAVAKIIAAEVLEMRARDGSDEGFAGSGVTVAGPSAATDYSRRLRDDAERELGPYLILPPAAGTDPSGVAFREAQAAKLVAETAALAAQLPTIPPRSAADLDRIVAETGRITAEAGKVEYDRARVEADTNKAKSDAVLAQLKAGVIGPEEARTLLGFLGAAPASAGSLSPGEIDARRRSVVNLLDRGLLSGGEAGLSDFLGLPPGVSLVRQVVIPVFTPSEPSGAS
ncbi:MAG: hypothetical protein H7145_08020, partial [Akkermansiaceae bacterium]|nr:hypothetical protein [Armatimonadota bacterium]